MRWKQQMVSRPRSNWSQFWVTLRHLVMSRDAAPSKASSTRHEYDEVFIPQPPPQQPPRKARSDVTPSKRAVEVPEVRFTPQISRHVGVSYDDKREGFVMTGYQNRFRVSGPFRSLSMDAQIHFQPGRGPDAAVITCTVISVQDDRSNLFHGLFSEDDINFILHQTRSAVPKEKVYEKNGSRVIINYLRDHTSSAWQVKQQCRFFNPSHEDIQTDHDMILVPSDMNRFRNLLSSILVHLRD